MRLLLLRHIHCSCLHRFLSCRPRHHRCRSPLPSLPCLSIWFVTLETVATAITVGGVRVRGTCACVTISTIIGARRSVRRIIGGGSWKRAKCVTPVLWTTIATTWGSALTTVSPVNASTLHTGARQMLARCGALPLPSPPPRLLPSLLARSAFRALTRTVRRTDTV